MSAWTYEYGTLWAIELEGEPPSPVQPRAPAAFKEVSRRDYGLLAEAMGLSGTEALLRRLAGRRRCFASWVDEHIAAYGWASQEDEWIGEQERCIQVSKNEAYIWDCFTLQAYRRQRLYSALLSHILSVLSREGVRRVWIGTALKNRPSIKGFTNAGFRPVLNLLHLRLFSLRAWWLNGDASAPEHLVRAGHRALIKDNERVWGPLLIGGSQGFPYSGCVQIEG